MHRCGALPKGACEGVALVACEACHFHHSAKTEVRVCGHASVRVRGHAGKRPQQQCLISTRMTCSFLSSTVFDKEFRQSMARQSRTRSKSRESSKGQRKQGTIDHSIRVPPDLWAKLKLLSELRERDGKEPNSQNAILLEGLGLVLSREKAWMKKQVAIQAAEALELL